MRRLSQAVRVAWRLAPVVGCLLLGGGRGPGPAPAAAAEAAVPTLKFLWAAPTNPRDKTFRSPQGLAFDATRQRLYVADTNGNRIVALNEAGVFLYDFKHWVRLPQGQRTLGQPWQLLPGNGGTLLVGDQLSSVIDVVDALGNVVDGVDLQAILGQTSAVVPGGMGRDEAGNLYVVDQEAARIIVLSPARRLLRSWGGRGPGEGQFDTIAGLAVAADGTSYVLDLMQNPVVQVFDPTGKRIAGFGRHGDKEADFHMPAALTLDQAGRLWIADSVSQDVKAYTVDGKYLADFGGMGLGPGEFYFPSDVLATADRLYVLERAGARLQAFRIVGS